MEKNLARVIFVPGD